VDPTKGIPKIVRISRGQFDPARADEVRRTLSAGEQALHAAIAPLRGLRGFYAAIDDEAGSVVNVSVWGSYEDARQMDTLAEMRAQRGPVEQAGVTFEAIVNYETLWST